jgi:hypothetical protein
MTRVRAFLILSLSEGTRDCTACDDGIVGGHGRTWIRMCRACFGTGRVPTDGTGRRVPWTTV